MRVLSIVLAFIATIFLYICLLYFLSFFLHTRHIQSSHPAVRLPDMNRDAFAAQRSRRRGATQGSAFMRDVPRYAGTDEDFERSHAQRYGREEGLGSDGKHHHGSHHFPRGSERQKLHTQYSKSTRPRDDSRKAYNNGLAAAERDYNRLDDDEREYHRDYTGGLTPYQHERLDPRAKAYRDDCFRYLLCHIFLEEVLIYI